VTFLIDSHIFLWALAAPNKLSESRQYLLENTDNTVLVSSMTVAELCIKASLGKLELVFDPIAEGEAAGFLFEPFTASAAF
jgi:PIN domain nuclease of toxin-antitoxin system